MRLYCRALVSKGFSSFTILRHVPPLCPAGLSLPARSPAICFGCIAVGREESWKAALQSTKSPGTFTKRLCQKQVLWASVGGENPSCVFSGGLCSLFPVLLHLESLLDCLGNALPDDWNAEGSFSWSQQTLQNEMQSLEKGGIGSVVWVMLDTISRAAFFLLQVLMELVQEFGIFWVEGVISACGKGLKAELWVNNCSWCWPVAAHGLCWCLLQIKLRFRHPSPAEDEGYWCYHTEQHEPLFLIKEESRWTLAAQTEFFGPGADERRNSLANCELDCSGVTVQEQILLPVSPSPPVWELWGDGSSRLASAKLNSLLLQH